MQKTEDIPLYYDVEKKKMYWIEWTETGNSDISTRHYINITTPKKKKKTKCNYCDGIGRVMDIDDCGQYEVECPNCGGTGKKGN